VTRSGYGIQEWENMIYAELANQRPVLYCANSNTGGHAFICDGYDGKGFFHINWGWDTDSDGFYSLSVLNPETSDVPGVASASIGFNMYQDVVIGIQKPTSGTTPANTLPGLTCYTNYDVNEKTDTKTGEEYYQIEVSYQYLNVDYPTATFEIRLYEAQDEYGDLTPISDVGKQTCSAGESDYYMTFDFDKVVNNRADGTVRIYPMYRCISVAGDKWHHLAAHNNYIEMTTKNGKVTMRSFPSASTLKVNSVEVTPEVVVAGKLSDVTVKFENGDEEFSGTMSMLVVFIGDNEPQKAVSDMEKTKKLPEYGTILNPLAAGAYIKANSTENVMFSFKPEEAGWYLLFVVPNTPNYKDINSYLDYLYVAWLNIQAATGISGVESAPDADGVTYDLMGRRVSGEKRGVYIKNGKKLIIR